MIFDHFGCYSIQKAQECLGRIGRVVHFPRCTSPNELATPWQRNCLAPLITVDKSYNPLHLTLHLAVHRHSHPFFCSDREAWCVRLTNPIKPLGISLQRLLDQSQAWLRYWEYSTEDPFGCVPYPRGLNWTLTPCTVRILRDNTVPQWIVGWGPSHPVAEKPLVARWCGWVGGSIE